MAGKVGDQHRLIKLLHIRHQCWEPPQALPSLLQYLVHSAAACTCHSAL
jgi:hypothetical protein